MIYFKHDSNYYLLREAAPYPPTIPVHELDWGGDDVLRGWSWWRSNLNVNGYNSNSTVSLFLGNITWNLKTYRGTKINEHKVIPKN